VAGGARVESAIARNGSDECDWHVGKDDVNQTIAGDDSYSVGGSSATVKSAPRSSLALKEGGVPSRASRGQLMLRVGSFQRMERSPAG
jgi:hypothetical protein